MDNPLFRKLQDAIEHPTRSKDWFGMAEQAINTIYNLAERPDIVCSNLIRRLTQRVFGKKAPVSTQLQPQPRSQERDPDAMDEDGGEGGVF